MKQEKCKKNVLGICEDEKLRREHIMPLNRVIDRATLYTSLSRSAVVSKKYKLIRYSNFI